MPSSGATPRPAAPTLKPLGIWDGGSIVYERYPQARLEILASGDTRARDLFPGFRGELFPVEWSTDGKRLIFYRLIPGTEARIYESDAAGSAPRQIATGCITPETGAVGCLEDDLPTISADGRRLAFRRDYGVVDPNGEVPPSWSVIDVVDLAKRRAMELEATKTAWRAGSGDAGTIGGIRWSPDGDQLVFHRYHWDDAGLTTSEIYVIGSDGSDLRRLTDPALKAGDPDWSPDGELIVFSTIPLRDWVGQGDLFDAGPVHGQDLYTIRPDGSHLERLTSDWHSAAPRWAPDGSILFTRLGADDSQTKTTTDFWLMNADSSGARRITFFGDCCRWYGDMQPLT